MQMINKTIPLFTCFLVSTWSDRPEGATHQSAAVPPRGGLGTPGPHPPIQESGTQSQSPQAWVGTSEQSRGRSGQALSLRAFSAGAPGQGWGLCGVLDGGCLFY